MKDREHVRQDAFVPTTKRIINEVLAAVGLTAPKFAEAVGVNYQRIFDLMRGRTKKFNPGIANLICEKFPQISKSFLFTGEGSVLVADEVSPTEVEVQDLPKENPSTDVSAILHRVVDMLADVNERSAKLTEWERQLNEREAALNARELDIEQREDNLGMLQKKTV